MFWRCWRLYGISAGVIYCRGAGGRDDGGADSESAVGEQEPDSLLFLCCAQPKAANLDSNPNIGAGCGVYCFPAILQIWARGSYAFSLRINIQRSQEDSSRRISRIDLAGMSSFS